MERQSEMSNAILNDKKSGIMYKINKFLGEGSFGKCYQIENVNTTSKYVVKIIPQTTISKTILKEINIHSKLSHPSIVAFHSYFMDNLNWYLILEHCRPETLAHMLTQRKVLTVPEVRYFMQQLAQACKYLHEENVIHGDLKLQNIFLNENMSIKVGDFGLALKVKDGKKLKSIRGSFSYMAPEIFFRVGYNYKVDIWALGCIIYVLLIGSLPFRGKRVTIKEKVMAGEYHIPSRVRGSARNLITRLLEPNPDIRPNSQEILEDYFMTLPIPPRLSTSCLTRRPKFEHGLYR
ncbi:hypothetical protein TNIN_340961 [Trichonephila inaurata madagascariensis]|uniref:Protein kinase domain-containing protein n=1 Tax=Trichonephila inaurata madagascariensis TaxID=2747483 RepID=A0A8X6IBE1_9ARAC|nr:hypothetical protein TNIN_404271 [Trichonephila inaurata madagascariensis]GFY61843.1 hypothetical protein TNIN_340961 [Trichonephila inaurata madagascariensis]